MATESIVGITARATDERTRTAAAAPPRRRWPSVREKPFDGM